MCAASDLCTLSVCPCNFSTFKMSVRKISLSQLYEAYEKSFKTFLDHSTARQAIVKCVQDGIKLALEKISPLDKNEPFNILGVGSGKGEMDLFIIQFIASQLKASGCGTKPAIHSWVVEPSSFLLEKFKTSAASLPDTLTDLAHISFEWQQLTFQEYKKRCAVQDKKPPSFDLIHFIHSIYYMDAADTLRTCFEQQLGAEGAILCLVQTERSFFAKIQRRFRGRLTFGSDMVVYTDKDLSKIAEENGWKYEVIRQEFSVDVSLCFGEPSEQGDRLFDFLTHQKDFRSTADQELMRDVLDFFGEFIVLDKNGNKLIKGPEMAAVVIYK